MIFHLFICLFARFIEAKKSWKSILSIDRVKLQRVLLLCRLQLNLISLTCRPRSAAFFFFVFSLLYLRALSGCPDSADKLSCELFFLQDGVALLDVFGFWGFRVLADLFDAVLFKSVEDFLKGFFPWLTWSADCPLVVELRFLQLDLNFRWRFGISFEQFLERGFKFN